MSAEFSDAILDLSESPQHGGRLGNATHAGAVKNCSCGDAVYVELEISQRVIKRAGFLADGCCLSQAGAESICRWLEGRSPPEVAAMTDRYWLMELTNLAGGQVSSRRWQCWLLGLRAAKIAIDRQLAQLTAAEQKPQEAVA